MNQDTEVSLVDLYHQSNSFEANEWLTQQNCVSACEGTNCSGPAWV